ncbi:MAG: hypothetical protein ACOVS5_03310 [Oligoflexus sp.]
MSDPPKHSEETRFTQGNRETKPIKNESEGALACVVSLLILAQR